MIKKSIPFFLLFFLLVSGCRDVIEEKCMLACKRYTGCTNENFNGKAPVKMLDSIEIQCMDICTREQSLLGCYEESGTSCKKYASCILHSGLFLE